MQVSASFSLVEINYEDFHDGDGDGDVDFNDVKETKIAGLSKFSKFLNGWNQLWRRWCWF